MRKETYKHYYLVDSCAFGRFIDPECPESTHNILNNIDSGAFYYIPQFCITEVFNMFAKWHFCEERIDDSAYLSLRNSFKSLIHDRKVLYPYDLHRYHNLNCDKIYETEQKTPKPKNKPKLSSFDILIIAMGLELQHIHGSDNVTILSCDERLLIIADKLHIKIEEFK
jgi:hypothetical protein